MAKRNLTDRLLQSLKGKPGKRYEIMDAIVPGLGVRVFDSGQRSFILISRFAGATNPTRRTIGEYPAKSLAEARDTARDWIKLNDKGIDPRQDQEKKRAAELRKQANTFASVA